MRSQFFAKPGLTLGKEAQVLSQAQHFDPAYPTDAQFVENVMWKQGKVVFVTLNVPGSNNDTLPWAEYVRQSDRPGLRKSPSAPALISVGWKLRLKKRKKNTLGPWSLAFRLICGIPLQLRQRPTNSPTTHPSFRNWLTLLRISVVPCCC